MLWTATGTFIVPVLPSAHLQNGSPKIKWRNINFPLHVSKPHCMLLIVIVAVIAVVVNYIDYIYYVADTIRCTLHVLFKPSNY